MKKIKGWYLKKLAKFTSKSVYQRKAVGSLQWKVKQKNVINECVSDGELRIKAFPHSKNSRNHDKMNLLGELERRIMPSHDLWQKERNSSKIRVREDIKCDKYGKEMANIPTLAATKTFYRKL